MGLLQEWTGMLRDWDGEGVWGGIEDLNGGDLHVGAFLVSVLYFCAGE